MSRLKRIFFHSMRTASTFLLFLSLLTVSVTCFSQVDTLRKYPNGNYLVRNSGIYELRNDQQQIISSWNDKVESFNFKKEQLQRIRKKEAGKNTEGLFNYSTGEMVLDLDYDFVARPYLPDEFFIAKKGVGFAIISILNKKATPFIYRNACLHLNNKNMIAFTEQYAHIYDRQLQLVDSLPGIVGQKGNISNGIENFMIVYLPEGQGMMDVQNQLIYEKGWKQIKSLERNRLVVATAEGFGVFDLEKKKLIAPYESDDFQVQNEGKHYILKKGKQVKLIDSTGKLLFEITADGIIPGYNWQSFFFAKDRLWGMVNSKGELIQAPIWKNFENSYQETFKAYTESHSAFLYSYKYKEKKGEKIVSSLTATPYTPAPEQYQSQLPPVEQAPPKPRISGETEENRVYEKVEVNPGFSKDNLNEKEYLRKAIALYQSKYKIKAKGTVVVSLIIEKNGTLSKSSVVKSDQPSLNTPSLKIIKEMTTWTPGQQNGRVVNSKIELLLEWK